MTICLQSAAFEQLIVDLDDLLIGHARRVEAVKQVKLGLADVGDLPDRAVGLLLYRDELLEPLRIARAQILVRQDVAEQRVGLEQARVRALLDLQTRYSPSNSVLLFSSSWLDARGSTGDVTGGGVARILGPDALHVSLRRTQRDGENEAGDDEQRVGAQDAPDVGGGHAAGCRRPRRAGRQAEAHRRPPGPGTPIGRGSRIPVV